ncbi:MAG: M23/M56 family metallopeptidase [Hyphomonas sp.]
MSPVGILVLTIAWSAVVWAGASLICQLRPAPRLAQGIWRGAACLMLAPFLAAAIAPGLPQMAIAPMPDVPAFEPFFIQQEVPGVLVEAAPQGMPDTGALLLAVIAGGWASRFALWLFSQVRLQTIKQRAYRVRRPLGHWAEAIGLVRVPDVYVTPRGAPFLAGLLRPAVFVPAALITSRDAGQILVHELVHLKRGDLLTRPLERLVSDIFWFTPFAWALRERLDYWREVVVDETAAELTGDRIAYARALTRAARLARPVVTLPVAALILPKQGTLKMRLNELLNDSPRRPRRIGLVLAAALSLAAPLALAQGLLIKGAPAMAGSGLTYSHAVLDKAKLTSTFGERKHPISGEMKYHNGVDLAEEEGKPIYAPAAATVTRAEYTDAYGNLVEVASGDTMLRFAQLKDINVKVGDNVTPGQTIATLGQSGKATGPHLHLEVWRDGTAVDPQAEEGLVLADVLRVTATSAPLAPKPAAGSVKPISAPAAPPARPYQLIPASAPLGSPAPASVVSSTAAAPADCPDKDKSGQDAPSSVS